MLLTIPILFGCSEYELSKRELGDVFTQLDAGAVDILLVVDNSGSMQPYQEQLASNFESFLTFFLRGNVDYQIGITTTSVSEIPNCSPPSGVLVSSNGTSVINASSPDPAGLFSDLVSVGICGSGIEMGLESGLNVLQNPEAGLIREEAYLSVIYVSDEQDASPQPVNDYINQMRAIKDPDARQVFNASALVVTDTEECDEDQMQYAVEGSRYIDVAEKSDGVVVNICDQDFASIVTDLSLNSSRLNDTFVLSNFPDVSTMLVGLQLVDENVGDFYDCDSEEYPWIYEEIEVSGEIEPALRFDRSKLPPVNAKITVQYNIGTPGQEFSCGDE